MRQLDNLRHRCRIERFTSWRFGRARFRWDVIYDRRIPVELNLRLLKGFEWLVPFAPEIAIEKLHQSRGGAVIDRPQTGDDVVRTGLVERSS